MEYYIGLDVSLKETFINIINKPGKVAHESIAGSDVMLISQRIKQMDYKEENVLLGIERDTN